MNDFNGGISPSAKVRILTSDRNVVHKRLSSLKPGEKLGQAGSQWYFAVNEVRIWKRRLCGYKITLESGEKLLMAESTITCGQFGPNLVQETTGELICFVIMNSFAESSKSRRTFAVEFAGGDQHKKLIAKLCRGSTPRKKQFYRFSEVLSFLAKLTAAHPSIKVVPCMEVSSHHKDNLYDFVQCVKPHRPFLPLINMKNLADGWASSLATPLVLAFWDDDDRVSTRRVVSCQPANVDGPWAFPIFDRDPEDVTSTQQRFSWTANGIPIFNAGALYVSDWAAEITRPKAEQDALPPMPPKIDYRFVGVGNSYETLCDHFEPSRKASVHADTKLNKLWEIIVELGKDGVSKEAISKHLISKIKETIEEDNTATNA